MIFKDRGDAGLKLAKLVSQEKDAFVVSLLRGGFIVGEVIAKQLSIKHLPLAAIKIGFPPQPELAIGAVCFRSVYLDNALIESLRLDQETVEKQTARAQEKRNNYCGTFRIQEKDFDRLSNHIVLLVDDGIATGSTITAARLFLETKKPVKIILAVPTAPSDFDTEGFDESIILDKNLYRSSVSQAYEKFPQVEDEEIKRLLNKRSFLI